jgi:meso-butanediol dehydrogenase/(S,S)-butanediol dehydrogenase/diacetyl reductase
MRKLEGKVALITGTAGGQGRAAALRFAQEGARVVGCDLQVAGQEETVEMVRAAGGEMVAQAPVDLSDESAVVSWIEFATSAYGDFDILYNNASAPRFAPVDKMSIDDWNFTLANELTLVFLAVKHAVPVLARKGGGCILNTASISGLGASMPGGFAHSATKAGVIAMTSCFAVELAPLGIRVNAIAPGGIDTPATHELLKSPAAEAVRQALLVPRFGTGDDIAAAAVFLCSDDASYVDGITLTVDGGSLVAGATQSSAARSIHKDG